ncbi:hypothetical protein M0R45_009164 [Rubus argutus]|uniref:Response regulatory domain-containing protein n=1 Tax=Rubus argutus TaxID=59490 RepID=A0AAW1Y694_RUBAR
MSNFEEAHVLVVDDSSVDRRLIERLLRVSSCKVTVVDSGLKALQLLGVDGLKVDLIITDYSMPGMTGYELLKKIKKSSKFKEISVVIMSSENVLQRIDRCLEEGAKDFILKPVKLADVKKLKNYMKKPSTTRFNYFCCIYYYIFFLFFLSFFLFFCVFVCLSQ